MWMCLGIWPKECCRNSRAPSFSFSSSPPHVMPLTDPMRYSGQAAFNPLQEGRRRRGDGKGRDHFSPCTATATSSPPPPHPPLPLSIPPPPPLPVHVRTTTNINRDGCQWLHGDRNHTHTNHYEHEQARQDERARNEYNALSNRLDWPSSRSSSSSSSSNRNRLSGSSLSPSPFSSPSSSSEGEMVVICIDS